MLKTLASSKALKVAGACICPVAGAGTLTMAVPEVRQAVHRATAPRAHARLRVRRAPVVQPAAAQLDCPPPTVIAVPMMMPTLSPAPVEAASRGVPGLPAVPGNPGPGFYSYIPPDIDIPFFPVNPGPGPLPPFEPPVTPPTTQPPTEPPVSVVPDPGTWALMLAGFAAVGLVLRNREQRASEASPEEA